MAKKRVCLYCGGTIYRPRGAAQYLICKECASTFPQMEYDRILRVLEKTESLAQKLEDYLGYKCDAPTIGENALSLENMLQELECLLAEYQQAKNSLPKRQGEGMKHA